MKQTQQGWNSTLRPGLPLQRTAPIDPGPQSLPTGTARKRIRARNPKRASEEREYAKLRKAYLAEHGQCAACGKAATEVHHTAGRDGWRLLYVPWWLPLCHRHHVWTTEHPEAAIAAGYSRRRHDTTGDE